VSDLRLRDIVLIGVVVLLLLLSGAMLIHFIYGENPVESLKDAASILSSGSIVAGIIGFWIAIQNYWNGQIDRANQEIKLRQDALEAQRRQTEEAVDREIRDWQKVTIHAYLQRNPGYNSFSDILEFYQAKAGTHPRLLIGKERLTEEELRRILLELLAVRIIAQNDSDRYAIEDWTEADDEDDDE